MNKNVKKILSYIGAFLIAAAVMYFQYSDNPFQKPLEKGGIISREQYTNLKKDTSSDDKRVAFIGRVKANTRITYKIGRPVELPVVDSADDLIEHIPFTLKKGGKNSFYVPAEFSEKDLVLYDNDGNPHAYDETVMVSFTMERIKDAIPEQNPQTGEYAWRCKLIRIDPIE